MLGQKREEARKREGRRGKGNLPGCSTPCSDTGVRGQEAGIKCGECGGIGKGLLVLRASSSRYQSLQEMYSRRGPSWRDSLHFAKTDLDGESGTKSGEGERIDVLVQRRVMASAPSRSTRASAARERTGTMTWRVQRRLRAIERERERGREGESCPLRCSLVGHWVARTGSPDWSSVYFIT